MMYPVFVPAENVAQVICHLHVHIITAIVGKSLSSSVLFPQWAFGEPIMHITSVSEMRSYHLHSLTWMAILFAIVCWGMQQFSFIISSTWFWWPLFAAVCGLLVCCLLFRLACLRFTSQTCVTQHQTVLMSTQLSILTMFIRQWMSVDGTFCSVRTQSLHAVYSTQTSSRSIAPFSQL